MRWHGKQTFAASLGSHGTFNPNGSGLSARAAATSDIVEKTLSKQSAPSMSTVDALHDELISLITRYLPSIATFNLLSASRRLARVTCSSLRDEGDDYACLRIVSLRTVYDRKSW